MKLKMRKQYGLPILMITILFWLNLVSGTIPISWSTVAAIILAPLHLPLAHYTTEQFNIIWQLRMLYTVDVLATGMALGLTGAVMQGLLRNSLADPALLGVSSGAGFMVILLVTLIGTALISVWMIPLAACLGSALVVLLLYGLSEWLAAGHSTGLLLAGVALNALFGAATMLLLTLAPSPILQSVFFWSLGGVSGISWPITAVATSGVILGGVILFSQATKLNVLSLGEHNAMLTGVNLRALRIHCVAGVALTVGASIALTGPIAFVGLMVPHLCRHWVGDNHHRLLPMSALCGSILLLLAQLMAHTLFPVALPLGVLTALLGAPFFMWLIWRIKT